MILRKVNPLQEQGHFWCPICDHKINSKVRSHPKCGVSFRWGDEVIKIPIRKKLGLDCFTAQALSETLGNTQTTAQSQLAGRKGFNPSEQVKLLKELYRLHKKTKEIIKLLEMEERATYAK